MQVKLDAFLDDFLNELHAQNAAVFAGAGLSVPAGYVDWKGLLAPLAKALDLDVDKEDDLVSLAQYHVTAHGHNRSDLSDRILNEFSRRQVKLTENHKILARLPIQTFWTTNYDTLIEDALRDAGKLADVKHTNSQLPHSLRDRDATVFKMHGDVSHPGEAIITKADYETYHSKHAPFLASLAGDLISKTFLFLGFSFRDPNLHYVLSRLRLDYGDNQKKHYCILKREGANKDDKPGDLEYRKTKQLLFAQDLLRYNIRSVMVDSYEDITAILETLEARFKQRTVFVSGAASDYGSQWTGDSALAFVHEIGKLLISNDLRIVSGLGLGVGSALIDGALTQIYHIQKKSLKNQLTLRPFPQSESGQQLWTKYRNDMLDYAGIAIFVFGNKTTPNGEVVLSNGMEEEFHIAKSKGLILLPVGFTGYMAKQLWETVQANLKDFYPDGSPRFLAALKKLGDTSLSTTEYIPAINEALTALSARA